ASHLRDNPQGADIYFDGIGSDIRIYGADAVFYAFGFQTHLEILHNVTANLRTNAPSSANILYLINEGTPKAGDLVILSNKSAVDSAIISVDSAMVSVDSAKFGVDSAPKGELIFKSGFPTIPHITLISLMKYVSAKYFGANATNANFFRLPRETYIFKMR
ncbi:hypothetical protein, partial [Helicobacter sp. 23-1045]